SCGSDKPRHRRRPGETIREQNRGQRCRPNDATALQTTPQCSSRLRQPPTECALAPSQLFGRFFLRPAFQITQNQRLPPLVRELAQLAIESRAQLAPCYIVREPRAGLGSSVFDTLP